MWPGLLETLKEPRPILLAQRQRLSYSAGPCDCALAALYGSTENLESLRFRLPSRTAIRRSRSTPRGPSPAVPRRFLRFLIDLCLDPLVDRRVHCRLRP